MHIESATKPRTDGELLISYCSTGDQRAFEDLCERYRPMVLRVCRHVIGSGGESEDAVQQVFVALSVKAAELQDRPMIAGWLYRVAFNISSKTRRATRTRKEHEKSVRRGVSNYAPNARPEPDMPAILREVIAELPDIYSQAIVLHYFCGHTTAEAAARLRCPAGTVAARVSRGLELLRKKLSDRDLVLTGVAIKLSLLAICDRSKAAVAAVPKGGPPLRPAPGRFPRFGFRATSTLGLMPGLFGSSRAAGQIILAAAALKAAKNSWFGFSGLGFGGLWGRFKFLSPLKRAGAVGVFGLACAGAGTATVHIARAGTAAKLNQLSMSEPTTALQKLASEAAEINKAAQAKEPAHASYSYAASTPVPEPGSATLLTATAIGLLARRRRSAR